MEESSWSKPKAAAASIPGYPRWTNSSIRSTSSRPTSDEISVRIARVDADSADTVPPMVQKHRRFALFDVTLDGQPMGGTTVDAWQDDDGREWWAARAMMPPSWVGSEGLLAGTIRNGPYVTGTVRVTGTRAGNPKDRNVLID